MVNASVLNEVPLNTRSYLESPKHPKYEYSPDASGIGEGVGSGASTGVGVGAGGSTGALQFEIISCKS